MSNCNILLVAIYRSDVCRILIDNLKYVLVTVKYQLIWISIGNNINTWLGNIKPISERLLFAHKHLRLTVCTVSYLCATFSTKTFLAGLYTCTLSFNGDGL